MSEQLLIPIAEAARMLGCCRQTLYRLEARKGIRFVRQWGRTMVPVSEVERIVNDGSCPEHVGEPVGGPVKIRPKKRQLFPQLT